MAEELRAGTGGTAGCNGKAKEGGGPEDLNQRIEGEDEEERWDVHGAHCLTASLP